MFYMTFLETHIDVYTKMFEFKLIYYLSNDQLGV